VKLYDVKFAKVQKVNNLILFFLFLPSFAFAQELAFLDVEVGFGAYELELKYIFKDTPAPYEGYLLQPHDIAILKVDLDSYKEDCESIVKEASLQCMADLQDCAEDCESRIEILSQDNYALKLSLDSQIEKLKMQKQNTILYCIATASLVWLTTSLYFILK
jgi:hypothetical protein